MNLKLKVELKQCKNEIKYNLNLEKRNLLDCKILFLKLLSLLKTQVFIYVCKQQKVRDNEYKEWKREYKKNAKIRKEVRTLMFKLRINTVDNIVKMSWMQLEELVKYKKKLEKQLNSKKEVVGLSEDKNKKMNDLIRGIDENRENGLQENAGIEDKAINKNEDRKETMNDLIKFTVKDDNGMDLLKRIFPNRS